MNMTRPVFEIAIKAVYHFRPKKFIQTHTSGYLLNVLIVKCFEDKKVYRPLIYWTVF